MSIVVVGDVGIDQTILTRTDDGPDEKRVATDTRWSLGGTAANAAAQVHRLGGVGLRLVAALGNDHVGGWARAMVAESGLPDGELTIRPGRTLSATILLRGSHREVIVDHGVSGEVRVDAGSIETGDLVYLTSTPGATVELVGAGIGAQLVVGVEHWMLEDPDLVAALDAVQLIVTNEAGGEAWRARSADSTVTLVETRGDLGARLWRGGVLVEDVAALPVPEVVDATGAGDAFAGALVHSLARGLELRDALIRAVAAGAVATGGSAPRVHWPTRPHLPPHSRLRPPTGWRSCRPSPATSSRTKQSRRR